MNVKGKLDQSGAPANPALSGDGVEASRPAKSFWNQISWDLAGRVGLLFIALCLIKLEMIAGFRKHLFEIHWRIQELATDWKNELFYYVFVALVGLNLWQLGTRCMVTGVKAVRAANLIVIVIGAAFIFLTYHVGDQNYLYSLMQGTLTWWSFRWYLALPLFFQLPFLGAWLLVYALIYYGLVRSGCEHLVLHVTTVFACIYLVFFLHDLSAYRNALLVADCFGVICLLAGLKIKSAPGWGCLILPGIWLGLWIFCFFLEDNKLRDPEGIILAGWAMVIFAGASALAWQRKFQAAWLWLLPFAFISFLLLTNINYALAGNLRNLFCLGLTLPRYFLGEFILAATLLAVAKLYRRWLPSASLWWLDAINLLLITLALADLRLSQIMGIRLDWEAVQSGADPKMVWRMAKPFLPEMTVGLVIVAGLYAILVGLWQRGASTSPLKLGYNGRFLLLMFLLLGISGSWFANYDKAQGESALLLLQTSPLLKRTANPLMDKGQFLTTAKGLGMEEMLKRPAAMPARAPRDMNVVLIFQESSYNKYLSLFDGKVETQPLLAKYRDRMELFPNFFCNFAASINARFATLAGLYPVRDYKSFTLHRVKEKTLYDILRENDYHCSVFDSCFFDYSGFRDFLQGRGIDPMYDADTMPDHQQSAMVSWGLHEGETVRAIQAQIRQYSTNHQKFFLTYFPVAPHYPFDGTPHEFSKFKLGQMGDYSPLYFNELLYMDWGITTIIDQLKDSKLLDNTLIIITDDHGEMLGENGGPIGHGWAVTPELANIPLIIMDPDKPGYHINDTVGSQIDLLPTLLDLLGIAIPGDQIYQGTSLYASTQPAGRKIYLNSHQQYGVIEDRYFMQGNRETEAKDALHGSSMKNYAITNDQARTIFPEVSLPSLNLPPISQFDRFQENFLENYSDYCRMIRTNQPSGN